MLTISLVFILVLYCRRGIGSRSADRTSRQILLETGSGFGNHAGLKPKSLFVPCVRHNQTDPRSTCGGRVMRGFCLGRWLSSQAFNQPMVLIATAIGVCAVNCGCLAVNTDCFCTSKTISTAQASHFRGNIIVLYICNNLFSFTYINVMIPINVSGKLNKQSMAEN